MAKARTSITVSEALEVHAHSFGTTTSLAVKPESEAERAVAGRLAARIIATDIGSAKEVAAIARATIRENRNRVGEGFLAQLEKLAAEMAEIGRDARAHVIAHAH